MYIINSNIYKHYKDFIFITVYKVYNEKKYCVRTLAQCINKCEISEENKNLCKRLQFVNFFPHKRYNFTKS